jgi:hypothetical protein
VVPTNEDPSGADAARRRIIYRWDLDKTYLRTEFDSLRDLLRTAFEPAAAKRTVPGASALLRELRATGPAAISILSGSPEQMRRVLEAKLRLDGIQWDSFTLKPSLEMLLRGRVRFLRDQVGYKLAALLAARAGTTGEHDEVCFGDDAEADAFIYSLYADLCAGRVGSDTLVAVLERARVYTDTIPRLVRLAADLPRRDCVRHVFIHLDRVSSPDAFADFGYRVCPFFNYFQPSLVLLDRGLLDAPAALRVATELVVSHGFTADALIASFEDVARRSYVGPAAGHALVAAREGVDRARFAEAAPVLRAFLDRLPEVVARTPEPVPQPQPVIDYVALHSRDRARAHRAKARVRARATR